MDTPQSGSWCSCGLPNGKRRNRPSCPSTTNLGLSSLRSHPQPSNFRSYPIKSGWIDCDIAHSITRRMRLLRWKICVAIQLCGFSLSSSVWNICSRSIQGWEALRFPALLWKIHLMHLPLSVKFLLSEYRMSYAGRLIGNLSDTYLVYSRFSPEASIDISRNYLDTIC